MTNILDIMALAKRTLERGEIELAAQMSVLALEGDEDAMFSDEVQNEQQNEADRDALNEDTLLDALQDGADNGAADTNMGKVGEVPIATVLELAHLTKQLRDEGFMTEARKLNSVIEALSRGVA